MDVANALQLTIILYSCTAELTQLQMKLRELNESASSVEADLRTAMAEQGKKTFPISVH